jgi:5-methylcytosine-specific restriction endonuclease McrBC GTP-binding regulatory subunit McrB
LAIYVSFEREKDSNTNDESLYNSGTLPTCLSDRGCAGQNFPLITKENRRNNYQEIDNLLFADERTSQEQPARTLI